MLHIHSQRECHVLLCANKSWLLAARFLWFVPSSFLQVRRKVGKGDVWLLPAFPALLLGLCLCQRGSQVSGELAQGG